MFSCIVPIWHVPHSIFHVSCFLASFHMHHVPCIVPFNYVSCVVLHVTYSLHYMTCVMFPCIVPHHYMSSQYVPWHMFPALSLCTMLTCCSSILCSIALFHYTLSHALFLSTMFPCSLFLCIPPLVTCCLALFPYIMLLCIVSDYIIAHCFLALFTALCSLCTISHELCSIIPCSVILCSPILCSLPLHILYHVSLCYVPSPCLHLHFTYLHDVLLHCSPVLWSGSIFFTLCSFVTCTIDTCWPRILSDQFLSEIPVGLLDRIMFASCRDYTQFCATPVLSPHFLNMLSCVNPWSTMLFSITMYSLIILMCTFVLMHASVCLVCLAD